MDNKLHYAHTFFCGHLAAVGRASEVQAADQRWQTEKPLTREAYERLSSIYYESFIDSLMQVDGQTSGAVYADTAHLTLETDRLCTLRHPKLPRRGIRLQTVPVPPLLLPLRHLPFRHGDRRRA